VRVLIVGSCSKRKLHNCPKQPKCQDIDSSHGIDHWGQQFYKFRAPARDMYTGPQSTELIKAVDLLRKILYIEVQVVIISAGFGILQEQDLVPVRKRSEELNLRSSFTSLINKNLDLIYLALGKRYLAALGTDSLAKIQTPTIVFHQQESEHLIQIPCSAETVKAFSKRGHKIHGVVGFKGDLLRVLARYALERFRPYNEVKKWVNPSYLRKLIYHLGGLENSG